MAARYTRSTAAAAAAAALLATPDSADLSLSTGPIGELNLADGDDGEDGATISDDEMEEEEDDDEDDDSGAWPGQHNGNRSTGLAVMSPASAHALGVIGGPEQLSSIRSRAGGGGIDMVTAGSQSEAERMLSDLDRWGKLAGGNAVAVNDESLPSFDTSQDAEAYMLDRGLVRLRGLLVDIANTKWIYEY